MRSYLTEEEMERYRQHDGTVDWLAPARWAILLRNWLLTAILFATVLVGLVDFVILRTNRVGLFLLGICCLVAAVTLALIEIKLFIRTYTRYVITPTRVMRMDGIVNRQVASIEWDKITDISEDMGVLGQMFGFGDISIETANESSRFGVLLDVPKPWEFRTKMKETRARLSRPAPTPLSDAAFRAMVALDSLLRDGSLLVEKTDDSGWRVRRDDPS